MISVGIPYYGAEEDVVRAHIRAIAASSIVPKEIIVVNDGHPNDLRVMLDELCREIRIKIVYVKILVDIPWNYEMANLCWFLCSSPYISIEDCDFFPTEEYYARGLAHLENGIDKFIAKYTNEDVHAAACGIYRREMLEKLGGWDEDFSGHYGFVDIWLSATIDRAGYKTLYSEERLVIKVNQGETHCINRDNVRNRKLLVDRLNGKYGDGRIFREKFTVQRFNYE